MSCDKYAARFFEESLAGLQAVNKGIDGKFRRVNANHFTATVYRDGKSVSACGVRLPEWARERTTAKGKTPQLNPCYIQVSRHE